MPDRTDHIFSLFGNYPQKSAPVADAETDTHEATGTGHYATAQEFLEAHEVHPAIESDPIFAEPEKYIAGYLGREAVVGLPVPLPGPVYVYPIAFSESTVVGFSFVSPTAVVVQFFDGNGASGRPALQVAVPAGGLTQLFPRILFPHGVYLRAVAADGSGTPATVDGSLVLERRVDSIPR